MGRVRLRGNELFRVATTLRGLAFRTGRVPRSNPEAAAQAFGARTKYGKEIRHLEGMNLKGTSDRKDAQYG